MKNIGFSRTVITAFTLTVFCAVLNAEEAVKATASSGKQSAAYAVDGKSDTKWESGEIKDKAWILIAFEKERMIKKFSLQWGNASAKKYTIEIQSKGPAWEEIGGVDGGKEGEYKYFDFGQEFAVSKLRINCIESVAKNGYSICDINFEPDFVEGIETGVMNAKVECESDPSQSYAIYLPKSYSRDKKKYSVVYGFSPDATGKDPVRLLKDAAEKHGFIIVGSNNARNGEWEPIMDAIKAVVADSAARFRVDQEKCYAIGFSGGARMSFRMQEMYPDMIVGVIPCCAGFPDDSYRPPRNLRVYGLSGTTDFNNREMQKALSSMGWPDNPNTQFDIFKGGHGWPPKKKLEEAMDWMFAE